MSRIVLCLAGCDSDVVPSMQEKVVLRANGLGEKNIEFDMDGLQSLAYTFYRYLFVDFSDGNSDVADIVTAFREVVLDGWSLNLPDGIGDSFQEGHTYDVMVSRFDIFGSMVDELAVPTLNPRLPLKVTFMGERGQDLGEPRREFLRLCLDEIVNRVKTGPDMSRDFDRSQADSYLEKKVYYVAGIVIVEFCFYLLQGLCILQDGPVPHFLCANLALVEGNLADACDKQLSDGLMKTGVLSLMRTFPQCIRLLHNNVPPPALTSKTIISSFEAIFSESGTGIRGKEEMMMGHFVKYVREVEGK
ncbi:uncharacterized protein LOC110981598 [Acanthaster planci]|uniref:Uncharacterized protein LOC110981598 n=1 Tax=Acanthaster planci TaxID=133434 RepID=A0A8B7YNW9_ACAPL|nr:uncharacterized protein LOC110981598 [Acanthaster planci]